MKNLIPLLFVILAGCTPSQRLTRLLQRNPELLSTLKQDSFDVTPFIILDTVVNYLPFQTTDEWLTDEVMPFVTDCPEPVQQKIKTQLRTVLANKPCLQEPINFYDTLHYHDSDIDIRIPIRVFISQNAGTNAFDIHVQGWGGKVLSHSKAFQTTGITQVEIKKYRRQGMKILAAWLGGAIGLIALLYLIYRVYTGSFGAGADWARSFFTNRTKV